MENNQRVFIHFLPLEEDIPAMTIMKLIQLENILTKDIIPLTEETADSIGNDRINATSLWITGNYLNIEHQFFHSNNPDKKHMLNPVINETARHLIRKTSISLWNSGTMPITMNNVRELGNRIIQTG